MVEELLELCGVILVCGEEADDSGRGEGRERLDPWLLSSIFQVLYVTVPGKRGARNARTMISGILLVGLS